MSIRVNNLNFSYGQKNVLHDICFSAEKGEFLSILGPNGAGKSTLLRCILGLLPGYSGEVLVNERNIKGFSAREASRLITYILPLAGDMLVGVSNAFAEDAQIYIAEDILNKTEIGQLYGGKREMDLEALLAADPDVVIDIGQAKKSMAEDFDALTEQTGIPFIHIDADVSNAAEAYRTLGKLLSREEKAEKLASWCENTYAGIQTLMEKVDADNARKTLLYCLGEKGTNVIAEGSFHA